MTIVVCISITLNVLLSIGLIISVKNSRKNILGINKLIKVLLKVLNIQYKELESNKDGDDNKISLSLECCKYMKDYLVPMIELEKFSVDGRKYAHLQKIDRRTF